MSASLETLESAWNSHPGGLMFAPLADALHRAGRTDDAWAVLSEGLQRWPKSVSARILVAKVALDRGDLETARTHFQEAANLDDRSPAALRGLADVLSRQQFLKQAIETWSRLSMLDPTDLEAAESAKRLSLQMSSVSQLIDPGINVQDVEDNSMRDALSEGASKRAPGTELGLGGGNDPFGFGLGFEALPSQGLSQANLSRGASDHPPAFTMPHEESSLATLEIKAFPSQTIPPPPLELPKAAVPQALESGTRILPEFPTAPTRDSGPDATTYMPRQEHPLHEVPAEAAEKVGLKASDKVTGEDVQARLDELFGGDGSSVDEIFAAPPGHQLLSSPSSAGAGDMVTGEDVHDRLDELLGKSGLTDTANPPPAPRVSPPVPAPAPTVAIDAPKGVTGDDVAGRLGEMFGVSALPLSEVPPPAPRSDSSPSKVTGRDVENRLESLFGGSVGETAAYKAAGDTAAMRRDGISEIDLARDFEDGSSNDVTALASLDQTVDGDTDTLPQAPSVSSPASTVFAKDSFEGGGSTVDIPTVMMPTMSGQRLSRGGDDVDSQLDELFASSEFLVDDTAPPKNPSAAVKPPALSIPNPSTGNVVVSGSDVEDRLDDLFGSDSEFPVGLPTVTLAEEYLRQGYKDQALAVYRQLLAKDPGNPDLTRRLSDIERSGT